MTTTAPATAPRLRVHFGHFHHAATGERRPEGATFSAKFATDSERDAFVARFPKWVGVKAGSAWVGAGGKMPTATIPYISLEANGVNGGRNETGCKRIRKLIEVLGDELTIDAMSGNAYSTIDEILAALS